MFLPRGPGATRHAAEATDRYPTGMIIRAEGRTLVAVIHRPRHGDWSLPKGKLGEGEGEAGAALREVEEETGAVVELEEDLGTVGYLISRAGRTLPKTVRYWAMRYRGGEFTANHEVDRLDWLPVPDAADRLSYQRDREVLARFAQRRGG
jgi:8-oxo-dGTP pyrophosphatase MutT (NUDIX family)